MNIYVCSTLYHILVSLCLLKTRREKGIFYLTTNDLNLERLFNELQPKLLCMDSVENVYTRKRNRYLEALGIEKIKDYFEHHKVMKNQNETEILLFPWNPHTLYTLSNFWFKLSDKVTLIEDGANVYAFPKPKSKKMFFKKWIYGFDFEFFNREKVKKIIVQYPEKYDFFPKEKLEKFCLKELISCLTEVDKEDIVRVFLSSALLDKLKERNAPVIILLTQPLSEDGYISENEKISKYQNLINQYKDNYDIVLKKHPRERTNYHFGECMELSGEFPSELFILLNINFSKAIGVCTSSIYLLEADEKINVDKTFFDNLRS